MMRIDLLVWMVGIPVLIILFVLLFFQQRQYRNLKKELKLLSKVRRHAIEYDLVMKAMKLTVWHIDVPTRTITYENDYRDNANSKVLPPGSDVELFCNTLTPESKEKIAAGMNELAEGRIEEFHEQFLVREEYSDHMSWGELFATVDKRGLDGKPVSIVGTSMNIDRQKDIEQALIEARNKAEESDRLKTAFLANMSHEIRTPLNAIVGFSDVLPMAQSEEERNELIALIKKNNAHLLRLFDDMVNMSLLDAGGEAVKKDHFDLNQLINEMVNRYTEDAENKGIRLETELMNDTPLLFQDRNRLREILNQYLNNALKFTEEGVVTVGYDIHDGLLRLWVSDTGKGIPAEYCNDQLFERFYKVDDFIAGTGLGLSICRSLAQSMGGSVGVESKESEGSLFWVKIDMA